MRVTIAVPGKFQPAYHWARYLEARGELDRIVTLLPYSRTAVYGVSRRRTVALGFIGAWAYLFQHYGPRRAQAVDQLAVNASFDRLAALFLGEPDIFNAWSGCSLTSMRRARRRGSKIVLQTGSTHIRFQTEVLREEAARFGWDAPITHPRLVERSVREYEEADVIVVVSEVARRTFVEQGVPDSKLALVPWAVRPVVTPTRRTAARNGKARVLFVGSCSLRKGMPYLLDAYRRLEADAELHLVGPIYDGLFERLGGLPEGVSALGPMRGDALAAEFAAADVFVIASIEEGSAFVVSEALHAGLPVVVTDRVGADMVVDGENGFVVPSRDSLALRARLDEILGNPDLRARMSEKAASTAVGRSWEEYGRDLEQVYRPLAEGRLRAA